MPAQWLSNSSDVSRRVSAALEAMFRALSRPANARRLRRLLVLLFTIWAVIALSQVIWALLPDAGTALPADAVVINPVDVAAPVSGGRSVDVPRVQGWHLFGEAGAAPPASATAAPEQAAAASTRDGIEKGARETRLALKLRGVVASSEDGLGYAIIEHNAQQDIYAVEDTLPLPGQVTLAKVMPAQVVLDNGGTYELLELFEDSTLDTQFMQRPAQAAPAPASPAVEAVADGSASDVAKAYRARLYDNPQSLAEVVTVSAVRENGELLGYRIAPGREREQFEQLGFRPGDLVTSVNGISLNDPANALRLYQTMRTATEAVFDLKRDNQPLTVSVSLGEAPSGQ